MTVSEFDAKLNKWIVISKVTVSPYGYLSVEYFDLP